LKVAYEYENKTFILELFKILRSSSSKWAVKIENFEKKIHGTVKILGSFMRTFSSSTLLADSQIGLVLYVWRSFSTAGHHLR
jgi:hypothetical protein